MAEILTYYPALLLANLLQVFLFFTGIYYLFLSFRGLGPRPRRPADPGWRAVFAVMLPAYNEEKVISYCLESLVKMDYPPERFDVWLVADHCTDSTAALGEAAGVKVLRYGHADGPAGKAHALAWATGKVMAARRYDAFCYFDADSLAHPGFLTAMNACLAAGDKAVQGRQLAKNKREGILPRILAAGHCITNRFFQRPKLAWGLSATLHGKGICLDAATAAAFPWDGHSLTEDLEMQMRLARHGIRIGWSHEAVVYDEEPVTLSQYVRRCVRWTRGALDTARKHLWGLWKRALLKKDPRAFEAWLYCAQAYKFALILLTAALIYYTKDGFNLIVWFYGVLPGAQAAMKALALMPLLIYPSAAILLEGEGWDIFAAYFLQPVLTALRMPIFAAGLLRGRDWWGRTEHASRVAISELAE
ncbi:MAG: glycosyltransferase family 2 protein [Elusimicrobiales bacterium]|nr:glycosyltransferase family 2 protein [Elusimicrobiales bacterium]